jgi:hypothetical protein
MTYSCESLRGMGVLRISDLDNSISYDGVQPCSATPRRLAFCPFASLYKLIRRLTAGSSKPALDPPTGTLSTDPSTKPPRTFHDLPSHQRQHDEMRLLVTILTFLALTSTSMGKSAMLLDEMHVKRLQTQPSSSRLQGKRMSPSRYVYNNCNLWHEGPDLYYCFRNLLLQTRPAERILEACPRRYPSSTAFAGRRVPHAVWALHGLDMRIGAFVRGLHRVWLSDPVGSRLLAKWFIEPMITSISYRCMETLQAYGFKGRDSPLTGDKCPRKRQSVIRRTQYQEANIFTLS